MCRTILPLIIFGSFTVTFADSVIQTDWSGGSGVWAPVTDWSNQFYLADYIDWGSIPGDIILQIPAGHTVDEDFNGVDWIYSEDIDGDGDMDILGAAINADDITWWENTNGSGTLWTEHTIDGDYNGARCVYSEDIDGDGDMDVLGAPWEDDLNWWENIDGSGTSWIEHTIDEYFPQTATVYSEDIDGDGDMDVISASTSSNLVNWWENEDGTGTNWIEHLIDMGFDWGFCIYAEDVNGDGDMDVLGASVNADDIIWWENEDGLGTSWIEHTVDDYFYAVGFVYSEDIDGDGDMDVLGASSHLDAIAWWENTNGSGTSWVKHTVDSDFDGASSAYAVDIDGDGDVDIIGSAWTADEIAWWENTDGSGTSWVKYSIEVDFDGGTSVYAEDFNGDGDMDVLGAARFDDKIAWWDLSEYSSEGSLQSTILNTGSNPQWASIDWNSSETAGTDLYFQYKTSSDYQNMGIWSDPIYEPCFLSGMLDKYFQYKVTMETDDPNSTPTLHDITLNWDPYGIEGNPCTSVYSLPGVIPNPICGAVSICFGLPEPSMVRISVFDLSGRLISEIHGDEYSMGFHDILIGDLSPGIYFCRMISGDFTATQRFVVIE